MESNKNLNDDLLEEKTELNVSRWKEYQTLIKEEITLNNIVKNQQETYLETVKKNYLEYYRSKLQIKETCDFNSKLLGISHNIVQNSIELVENTDRELLEVFDPLSKFLFSLRNNDLHMINVMQSVNKSEEIDDLVNFLSHFFYENILIQNPEQEQILGICYLLLEKEVENLNTPSVASFLDRSFIGRFLKSLSRRQDIKAYLSMILGDIILKMENSNENFLEIDPNRIYENIKSKKVNETVNKSFNLEKSKKIFEIDKRLLLGDRVRKTTITRKNTTILDSNTIRTCSIIEDSNSKIQKNNSISFNFNNFGTSSLDIEESHDEEVEINNEYLIDLTQDQLQFKFETEENLEMKEFYFRQLSKIEDDKNMFTNQKFLEHLSVYSSESYSVIVIYKRNFEKIKFFIDQLFNNLIENDTIIPYVVKCICKMIDCLITKKFPDLGIFDRYSFMGEFLFGKLIMPILFNPDYNGIISSSIVSLNTRKNLFKINNILKKISRASFFDSTREMNYTIFNTYLIEIIPMITSIYKKIQKVKFPRKIEELLKLKTFSSIMTPNTFSNTKTVENVLNDFKYFKENVDQLVNIQAVCFSIQDIQILIRAVKSNLDLFVHDFSIKKSLEKIDYHENYLQNKLKESSNSRKIYIIFNTEYNPCKIELLYPKQFRFTFTHDNTDSDKVDREFTLNRVKYCIKTILRSLNIINARVYSRLSEADTTEKLFLALKKIIELEDYSDSMTNDKIPLSWYSLYLNSNLQLLNREYLEDNYKKLYEELITEVKNEILMLNQKSNLIITKYGTNIRCAETICEAWRKDMMKVKNIERYIRVEKFIDSGKIPVCVRNRSNRESIIESQQSILISKPGECIHRYHFLDRALEGKAEKKSLVNNSSSINKSDNKFEGHCETIGEFIQYFQNFSEIKEEIIFGDQRNKIFETFDVYLSLVKEQMLKHNLFANIYNEENIHPALEDVENYILEKINKKVFPEKPIDKDILFKEQCCKLEWITPTHLEIKKNYTNERLWESAIYNLNRMDVERSPVSKLKCVQSAYKIINNCINFCSGKEENAGVDDIIPILIYIIIHSKPQRMFSNIQYVKTFMNPSKLLATYGFLLTQIEMATEFIFGITYKMLKISEEEFQQNINEHSFNRTRANSRVVKKTSKL